MQIRKRRCLLCLAVDAIRAMNPGRNSFPWDSQGSAWYAKEHSYLRHRSLEHVSKAHGDCLICSFKEFKDE